MKLWKVAVGLMLLGASTLAITAEPPKKNPLDRQWLVVISVPPSLVVGVDISSFTVVKPADEFTYDMLMVSDQFGTVNGKPVGATVSTMKVSCSKRHAQVMKDTAHGADGAVIAENQSAKKDKMSEVDPSSPVGMIMGRICTGQSLVPPKNNGGRSGS